MPSFIKEWDCVKNIHLDVTVGEVRWRTEYGSEMNATGLPVASTGLSSQPLFLESNKKMACSVTTASENLFPVLFGNTFNQRNAQTTCCYKTLHDVN